MGIFVWFGVCVFVSTWLCVGGWLGLSVGVWVLVNVCGCVCMYFVCGRSCICEICLCVGGWMSVCVDGYVCVCACMCVLVCVCVWRGGCVWLSVSLVGVWVFVFVGDLCLDVWVGVLDG